MSSRRNRRPVSIVLAILFIAVLPTACGRARPQSGSTSVPSFIPTDADLVTGESPVTPTVSAEDVAGDTDAAPAASTPVVATPVATTQSDIPEETATNSGLMVSGDTGQIMHSYLTSLTDNGQFMGSVLVAKDSQLILVGGYGLADIEAPRQMRPEERYRIGSLTKQFTAAAILRLEEQGLVDVRSPLSAYLPDYPVADRITVHHLLTHTSGIPDYERLPVYMETLDEPVTTAELLARFAELPLEFPPGERFSYSSSNYMVLTRIIEVVSGKSYEEFLRDEFFEPLYMTKTGMDTGDTDALDRAKGYIPTGEQLGPARAIDMSIPSGAGAMVSNVFDLYGWTQALQIGVALEPESVVQLFTPHVAMDTPGDPTAAYGYGWVIDEHMGRTRIWHPGHIFGYAADVAVYPEESATVVVLSNVEGAPVRRIQEELAGILFTGR